MKPPMRYCVECNRPVGRRWNDYLRCSLCRRELESKQLELGDSESLRDFRRRVIDPTTNRRS